MFPIQDKSEWEGTFSENYTNGHTDSTTIKCDGSMFYRQKKSLFTSKELILRRVNEHGVPRPDLNYQGWYFRPWSSSERWQYFRFTSNGELEGHHFSTKNKSSLSPFGSLNYFTNFSSSGGKRCKTGNAPIFIKASLNFKM